MISSIKKITTLTMFASLLTSSALYAADPTNVQGTSMPLTSDQQKLSYTVGVKTAQDLKMHNLDVDSYLAGYKDMATGNKLQLTDKDMDDAVKKYQAESKAKHEQAIQQMQESAKVNIAAGNKFLENNKTDPTVKVTSSGLQYKIITAGTGAKPTLGQYVTVNYRGSTVDGKEFDSSYARNSSATFQLVKGGLIDGWVEALQMMPIGSTWKIVLPASLGYGERGSPPAIAPNAVLIFDIELLGAKDTQ